MPQTAEQSTPEANKSSLCLTAAPLPRPLRFFDVSHERRHLWGSARHTHCQLAAFAFHIILLPHLSCISISVGYVILRIRRAGQARTQQNCSRNRRKYLSAFANGQTVLSSVKKQLLIRMQGSAAHTASLLRSFPASCRTFCTLALPLCHFVECVRLERHGRLHNKHASSA